MAKKRILSKLKLSEISMVDRPCQEHAKFVIAKRDVSKDTKPASGSTGDTVTKGEDSMADDNEMVAELEGQVSDLEAQIDELNKQLEAAAKGNGSGIQRKRINKEKSDEDDNDLQKKLDALQKQNDEYKAKELLIEKYTKALEALTPSQMDIYKAMKDEEKQEEWLKMSPDERKKKEEEMSKGEESVVISGRTIKKSVVGEDTFVILKTQAEQIAKAETDIAKERDAREMAELTKRADDQYSHVPGSVEERAAMLKAIAKMDEPLRKSFEAVLEQSEKLAKAGFGTVGHSGKTGKPGGEKDINKAAKDFEALVEKVRVEHKLSHTDAAVKVRREHPDLFKAYQEVDTTN